MPMVFAGALGRQNAASQQKLRAIRQRPTEEILLHFSRNQPACSSWIAFVKPIHVYLFSFLVTFVSDQDYNQDKYLNLS